MFYVISDILLKVSLNTNKTGPVLLVFNNTFNNVSGITYDMLGSFIGINATVNNISAMIYNMAFSHHVLRYIWHIIESVVKHQ
jgi:hypothetical protein